MSPSKKKYNGELSCHDKYEAKTKKMSDVIPKICLIRENLRNLTFYKSVHVLSQSIHVLSQWYKTVANIIYFLRSSRNILPSYSIYILILCCLLHLLHLLHTDNCQKLRTWTSQFLSLHYRIKTVGNNIIMICCIEDWKEVHDNIKYK